MARNRKAQRWLLQITTGFQWEAAAEILERIAGRCNALELKILHEGKERHLRVEADIREWAAGRNNVTLFPTQVELLRGYFPARGQLRPVWRRWDGVITSTVTIYPGFAWQFRRYRPRRVVVVDDGLPLLHGLQARGSKSEVDLILSMSPRPRHVVPFPGAFVRHVVLPGRLDFYSLFDLPVRSTDRLHARSLPRVPRLPVGDWVLVAGPVGVDLIGVISPAVVSTVEAVRARWPDRRVVYLEHPEYKDLDVPDCVGLEVLSPVADWRDLLTGQGSYPAVIVSAGSSLAVLVRMASGERSLCTLVVPRPIEKMSPDYRDSYQRLLRVPEWGPRDVMVLDPDVGDDR